MAKPRQRLLVVQVAGLGYDLQQSRDPIGPAGLVWRPLTTVFPALTCTVQASFRTATLPTRHGMIANGLFHRELRRPLFWEQAATLVGAPRIWDTFREQGGKVAMLFWQQSLGESVDTLLSPAPVHKHHGGIIQDCYSKPTELYPYLCDRLSRPFRLERYWGPMASPASSQWIAEATAALLASPWAPDLCLTYLPALDYDLQRFGPNHAKSRRALACLHDQLTMLTAAAQAQGYELVVFGDYAIGAVPHGPVCPNRVLREHDLFATRTIRGMVYPDLYDARAFAMVDHEIAHVYVRDPADRTAVAECLGAAEGIATVLDANAQAKAGIDHANSGDLVLVAEQGYWLAYSWLNPGECPPDYARHVDIHNKPGYDPCELFHGWPPFTVSTDGTRIGGSHGRTGPGREACWASTCLDGDIANLTTLASSVRTRLGEDA